MSVLCQAKQTYRIAVEQHLSLRAALENDRALAVQSLLLDSLVALPTDKVEAMLDEMLAYIHDGG